MRKKTTVKIQFKLLRLTCVTKFFFQMHKSTSFKIKCLLKYAPNVLVASFLGIMHCNAKREDFYGTRCFFDSMILAILSKLDWLYYDRVESNQIYVLHVTTGKQSVLRRLSIFSVHTHRKFVVKTTRGSHVKFKIIWRHFWSLWQLFLKVRWWNILEQTMLREQLTLTESQSSWFFPLQSCSG